MSEERLRDAERRWQESGNEEDHARFLQEALRGGEISQRRLEVAAQLGNPVARLVLEDDAPPLIEGDPGGIWRKGHWDLLGNSGGILMLTSMMRSYLERTQLPAELREYVEMMVEGVRFYLLHQRSLPEAALYMDGFNHHASFIYSHYFDDLTSRHFLEVFVSFMSAVRQYWNNPTSSLWPEFRSIRDYFGSDADLYVALVRSAMRQVGEDLIRVKGIPNRYASVEKFHEVYSDWMREHDFEQLSDLTMMLEGVREQRRRMMEIIDGAFRFEGPSE